MSTLYVREASGFREATSTDVLDQAHGIISRRFRRGAKVLHTPAAVRAFLRLHLGHLDHEVFGVIHLDTRHRLIAVEDLFRGTLNAAQVHPREVVKSALAHNAMYIIAYHNHVLCCVECATTRASCLKFWVFLFLVRGGQLR